MDFLNYLLCLCIGIVEISSIVTARVSEMKFTAGSKLYVSYNLDNTIGPVYLFPMLFPSHLLLYPQYQMDNKVNFKACTSITKQL